MGNRKLLIALLLLFTLLFTAFSAQAYGPTTGDVGFKITGVDAATYGANPLYTGILYVNLPFGNYQFFACVYTPSGWRRGNVYSYVSPNQAITVSMTVTQFNPSCTNYNNVWYTYYGT